MKRLYILLLCLCAFFTGAKAWDFVEPNEDGDSIYFVFSADPFKVYFDDGMAIPTESRYETDTFRIPEAVIHDGIRYNVVAPPVMANSIFNATKANPRYVYIPKTYQGHYELYKSEDIGLFFSITPNGDNNIFEGYVVDNDHPHFSSEDGVIFSKYKDTLSFFPYTRKGTYIVPNYVQYLGSWSFLFTQLDSLILPDDIFIEISNNFLMGAPNMKSFRFPNSITTLTNGTGISGESLEEIIFGSGLTYLGGNILGGYSLKRVICLAVTPPQTTITEIGAEEVTLFVPRKSIGLYRQAPGWNKFYAIEPIEPPVISGINSAEISWVTNAEAYSYTLTLYLDEAQTRRLMTLTFDEKGYLTNMDISIDAINMPASMPHRVKQAPEVYAEEDSQEFNSYLSFTVTGLSANTEYFYVRKTYNALGEIIDEETGSFETQSDGEEGLEQNSVISSEPQKMIKDGQVLIRSGNATYNVQGSNIRK